MQRDDGSSVMTVTNLTEFFRDALQSALAGQRTTVDPQAERYVVNLLTEFARSERFYDLTPEGRDLRPLAQMLAAALEASTETERALALRRLGDVSLFTSAFFARGFERKLVDVDYHVAMGSRAYETLADTLERGRRREFAEVFAELAAKFQLLVDALGEIADAAYVHSQRDVLRLYEIWLKTGSTRARRLLQRLGIDAAPVALRAQ